MFDLGLTAPARSKELSERVRLPEELLHAESRAREGVVLRDRHVDDLVDIQEGIEYLPLAQDFSFEIDIFKARGLGQDDFRTGTLRSFGDAGALKTAARLVAAYVGHYDALRS